MNTGVTNWPVQLVLEQQEGLGGLIPSVQFSTHPVIVFSGPREGGQFQLPYNAIFYEIIEILQWAIHILHAFVNRTFYSQTSSCVKFIVQSQFMGIKHQPKAINLRSLYSYWLHILHQCFSAKSLHLQGSQQSITYSTTI